MKHRLAILGKLSISRALAPYDRTLISFDSLFDHFSAGDQNAMDV